MSRRRRKRRPPGTRIPGHRGTVTGARRRMTRELDENRERLVFDASDHECVYCTWDGKQSATHHMLLTVDHLIPRARGGSDEVDNLVCACLICNRLKGHWTYDGVIPDAARASDESEREFVLARVREHIAARRAGERREFDALGIGQRAPAAAGATNEGSPVADADADADAGADTASKGASGGDGGRDGRRWNADDEWPGDDPYAERLPADW